MDGFIDDYGIILVLEGFEEGFTTLFHWEESEKPEIMHMHSGSDERRENRGSSGNRDDGDMFFYCPFHEDIGWIGDSRSPRVRYEGDIFPFHEKGDDFLYFHISGMGMKRDERFRYLIVIQEDSGSPGVLAGDDIRLAKSSECAEGDILEVSDGSRDDGEHRDDEELGFFIKYSGNPEVSSEEIDEYDSGESDGERYIENGMYDDGESESIKYCFYIGNSLSKASISDICSGKIESDDDARYDMSHKGEYGAKYPGRQDSGAPES